MKQPAWIRPFAVASVCLLVLGGCDPGWALAGRNNDDKTWLVRVRIESLASGYKGVYRLGPGDVAHLEGTLGAPPTGRIVELLDDSCTVVASIVLDPLDEATVEITPDAQLEVVTGYPPDDQLPVERPEVFETCGGRPDHRQ